MLREILSFEKEDNQFNKRSKGVNFILGDERMVKKKEFTQPITPNQIDSTLN
jgi:hypothetical protein